MDFQWLKIPTNMRDKDFLNAAYDHFQDHSGNIRPFLDSDEELCIINTDELEAGVNEHFAKATGMSQNFFGNKPSTERVAESLYGRGYDTDDSREIFLFIQDIIRGEEEVCWIVVPTRVLAEKDIDTDAFAELKENPFKGYQEMMDALLKGPQPEDDTITDGPGGNSTG